MVAGVEALNASSAASVAACASSQFCGALLLLELQEIDRTASNTTPESNLNVFI